MYIFNEPRLARNLTISLEKQDGRRSEQTFLIIVRASPTVPSVNITAATISSLNDDGSVNDNDYSISTPGSNTILLTFRPEDQVIEFDITLYPDNIAEGLEAFQVERFRNFSGPPFRPPTSQALFSSSFVIIDECKLQIRSKLIL